jgi:hypothetical protein
MLTPISMFYENSPEEIEQDPHFHEPSFNFTGDDGEFEEGDEGLPSFVRAQEPSDKSQKDALGEFTSIFYEGKNAVNAVKKQEDKYKNTSQRKYIKNNTDEYDAYNHTSYDLKGNSKTTRKNLGSLKAKSDLANYKEIKTNNNDERERQKERARRKATPQYGAMKKANADWNKVKDKSGIKEQAEYMLDSIEMI